MARPKTPGWCSPRGGRRRGAIQLFSPTQNDIDLRGRRGRLRLDHQESLAVGSNVLPISEIALEEKAGFAEDKIYRP